MTVRAGATAEIMLNELWHVRLPVNDIEIADCAKYIQELMGRELTFTAADTGVLFRARGARLDAVRMLFISHKWPLLGIAVVQKVYGSIP